jgi:excisionase family DNA binding protein
MPESQERLLSPNNVAERLNISPLTVRRWLKAGKLKGVRLGRLWRVLERDLEAFLQKCGDE